MRPSLRRRRGALGIGIDLALRRHGRAAAAPSLIHQSLFAAANGTSLAAYTPDLGNAWTQANGTWEIQSNQAKTSGASPANPRWLAHTNLGVSDYRIVSTVTIGGTGNTAPGILVRYVNNSQLFFVQLAPAGGAEEFQIWEYTGSFTKRAATAFAFVIGTPYTVEVTCEGQSIAAVVSGGPSVSYGSASAGEGSTLAGMRCDLGAHTWDSWEAWTL